MTPTTRHFAAHITLSVQLDYALYLPADYADSEARLPLLLFLHGAGGRGNDIQLVRQNGIPHLLENGLTLPCIVLAPQCPADSHWTLHVEALNALLSEVIAQYRVAETQVYVTGMSLGAAGTWMLAGAYPQRFAAIAPVSGRIVPLPLTRFKTLPIRVYHGDADTDIPFSAARRTVDALQATGVPVELVVYAGGGHDIWQQTYSDPDFYAWLLQQQRA